MRTIIHVIGAAIVVAGTLTASAAGEQVVGDASSTTSSSEYAQWCGRPDRNRVANATGLADSFEGISSSKTETQHLRNVKWVAWLGDLTYGSPVVAGGQVYMGGKLTGYATKAIGALWCFRESDGGLLWRLRTPFIKGTANLGWGLTSTPTVEGDRVYLLGQNGEVFCLDANGLADGNAGPFQEEAAWLATGREVVKNEIDAQDQRVVEYSDGTPVIHQGRVYVSLANDLTASGPSAPVSRLVCIDATKTGDITATGGVWKFDDLRSCGSTVAIADGLLYTGDASGMVYCLDAATGEVYWSHQGKDVWASPLVADGKVFVPTHGKGLSVFATGKTKKIISESSANLKLAASPAVANGALYFADQKYLYAVRATPSNHPNNSGNVFETPVPTE